MKTYSRLATYQRLRQQPQWRLLAADHAPAVLALLGGLLLEGERTLPASMLHERLARELDELRLRGMDLPRTAQAYVADWLSAGWLERRFPEGGSEEVYELSTQAIAALRWAQGLDGGRSAATESRLALVIQQLAQLAAQTDRDVESRLRNLHAERERLDRQIAAVAAGQVDVLEESRALERAREVIALADELSEDFRQVRDEFQRLNREFRERVIEDEGQRGEVLEALFAGVDLIAQSEAGRSFEAFWRLLTDAEQSAQLEAAIDAVLTRDFASGMSRRERSFLLQLTRTLLDRGGHVHEVFQHFARSLKSFVQSREYLEQRRLSRLLKQAQAEALALRDRVRAEQECGFVLRLSSSRLRSLSQWRLHDPRARAVETRVQRGAGAQVSLESVSKLVAQSEIDFRTLRGHVVALLDALGQCSIGAVLERYPAEQGLGSVVGYLTLGSRHGFVSPGQSEVVSWSGQDGQTRRAAIPLVHFVREKRHELV
jgi:hypothetical protein